MNNRPPRMCDSTLQAMGNTPVIRLRKVVPAESAEVLVIMRMRHGSSRCRSPNSCQR